MSETKPSFMPILTIKFGITGYRIARSPKSQGNNKYPPGTLAPTAKTTVQIFEKFEFAQLIFPDFPYPKKSNK